MKNFKHKIHYKNGNSTTVHTTGNDARITVKRECFPPSFQMMSTKEALDMIDSIVRRHDSQIERYSVKAVR